MAQRAFEGVLTAIVTPFNARGEIDWQAFERLLKAQRAAGVHGIVIGGTTGESPTLTEDERFELMRVAMKYRTEDFFIHVNVGTYNTAVSVSTAERFAAYADEGGNRVDGLMAVVPYYNRPSQDGMIEHFKAIAQAAGGLPLCVYNVPSRTGGSLLPVTFQRLLTLVDNVVAIKEAGGDVKVFSELRRLIDTSRKPDTRILSGDDATFGPSLVAGADGVISVSSHVIPAAILGMQQAALRNNFDLVRTLHLRSMPLNLALFCATNPTPLKWMLAQMGFCEEQVRLPLVPINEKEKVMVRGAWDLTVASGLRLASVRDAER